MKSEILRKEIIKQYIEKWIEPNRVFNSNGKLTANQNWKFNDDGTVDIFDSIVINNNNKISKIPVKFNDVYGNFSIVNRYINSLENCPKVVRKNFTIDSNSLKNLKYSPDTVGEDYYVFCSELESIEGISPKIDRLVYREGKIIKDIDKNMLTEQNCKINDRIIKIGHGMGYPGRSGPINKPNKISAKLTTEEEEITLDVKKENMLTIKEKIKRILRK